MSTSTTTRRTAPTGADRTRQVVVTLSEVFCVVGTLVGVGVLGTEVSAVSDGALAADATLVAPAGPAFGIWSVIYAGLAAYTVWQWLPSQAAAERHRRVGWLVAASMVLNAAWLLVTQQAWIWPSVVVIVALLLVLVEVVRRLCVVARTGPVDLVVTDGTLGLYLGWVTVATGANVAAASSASGLEPTGGGGYLLAVAILVAVTAVGALQALRLGGRLTVAGATAWGLAWVAVGRTTDAPTSTLVAGLAVVAAVTVVGTAVAVRTGRIGR